MRPRTARLKLIGRTPELNRILTALRSEGAHIVLYSERGRGKTSLANLAVTRLRRSGVLVARHACEADSDYDSMMRGLAADLPASLVANVSGEADPLPTGALRPQDLAALGDRIPGGKLVFLVDEFDRVQDAATRTRLADTIKLLSDRASPIQFMIVGVAATLEHIIGQHPSIQRNVVAVHLPLLTDAEIGTMLREGGEEIGLEFGASVISFVVGLARGMPYMAQLLGLRLAQSALSRGTDRVASPDLAETVDQLIDDAQSGVALRYTELTAGGEDKAMQAALYAVATAPQDRYGCFVAVANGVPVIPAQPQRRLLDEGILQPCADPARLRIGDRSLFYHVLLLALRDRLAGRRENSASTIFAAAGAEAA